MSRYKKTLAVLAVVFAAVGIAQVLFAWTYHRDLGLTETDRFVHYYYPSNDGLRYEGLYDAAVTLQMQVSALTTTIHTLTGIGALLVGLFLFAFAHDRYVHAFGRVNKAAEHAYMKPAAETETNG